MMQSKGKAWIFGAAGAGVALVAMIGAVVLMSTASEANAATCARGTKPAVIGGNFKCLRVGQRCSMRYQGAYRRYSFHCANGRLRRGTGLPVTPPPSPATPPPPPAATPAAVDGHYKGVTSQNENFEFDIVDGGQTFTAVKTGQINQVCTPYFKIRFNYLDWTRDDVPVSMAGDFTIDVDRDWYVEMLPASQHITLRGHMAGPVGSGSLEMKTEFSAQGGPYVGGPWSCASGLLTWTVTRTG